MTARARIANDVLPGWTCEGGAAREIFDPDGTYRGHVEYVALRRRAPVGSPSATGYVTDYGWRRVGTRSRRLYTLVDAVRRLADGTLPR